MRRLSRVDRDELKITFTIIFLLEYSRFTILRQFLLRKEVNQVCVYVSPLPPELPSRPHLTLRLITELVPPEKAQEVQCWKAWVVGASLFRLMRKKEGPLFE